MFKKILVNMLVLMVVMLPLRNSFAMPMESSSKHCMAETVKVEASMMMNHAGHHMPSSDMADTSHQQKKSACACCSQCDGACTGCVHISAAINFNPLQFSHLNTNESVPVIAYLLLTRTISPPSRPPLVL